MRYFIFILTLLFSVTVNGQNYSLNQGGTSAKNYYVELPYQLVHGVIVIDVKLAGKKHKFIFDTGAPTAISEALTRQLKSTAINKFAIEDSGGRSDSTTFVRVDDLKLGDVSFSGIPALGKIPDFFKCFQLEGIIGSNLVRGSIVSLQSDRQVMVITDQPDKLKLDKTHAGSMAITSTQSTPYIVVNICGGKLTMPFDTGMDRLMTMEPQVLDIFKKAGISKCLEVVDQGFGAGMIGALGVQPDADKYLLKFPALQIGSANFENVYAETDKGVTPVIGSPILNYGNVTLDYINKQFYYDPRKATIDVNQKHWPFKWVFKDGKLVVALVWSEGKGLAQLGEQILSINGKDWTHSDMCDFMTEKSWDNQTSATLIILDAQGTKRTLNISKK